MYQKINDEKKICVCKEKCTLPGCVHAFGAQPPHPRNGPDTTPLPYPNGQNPGKMEVHLGSCVGVGLTSGTAVEETDYRQTPTSPTARWLSSRNDEVEEIDVARTPRNMVSDGGRAGGMCRTPGRECLFWPMPPYYSYYYLYRGFEVLATYSEHINIWLQ